MPVPGRPRLAGLAFPSQEFGNRDGGRSRFRGWRFPRPCAVRFPKGGTSQTGEAGTRLADVGAPGSIRIAYHGASVMSIAHRRRRQKRVVVPNGAAARGAEVESGLKRGRRGVYGTPWPRAQLRGCRAEAATGRPRSGGGMAGRTIDLRKELTGFDGSARKNAMTTNPTPVRGEVWRIRCDPVRRRRDQEGPDGRRPSVKTPSAVCG